ncbi:glutathione synthetase-like [Hydractinia symbiolongicarpus]|uniref:glutathione synthetase-like n=1 Tax=Hydractinia symbiolongicarpus TaxID=13093 RepID=UPI002549E536|nr:glutathione synthetase-like [Hydractinia symbiolongicarpus]
MEMYKNTKLNKDDITQIAQDATDWATIHGIVMRNGKHKHLTNFAPFMLFPTPFPTYLYDEAMMVQKDFHTLVHRASLDHEFIHSSLKSVIVHDEFTKRQYEIYDQVRKEGIKPKFNFNIIRSDYMVDETKKDVVVNGHTLEEIRPYEIKQIEVNMIAASFGGLDSKVEKLHRYMADVIGQNCPYKKDQVATNTTLENLADGMAKLWQLYGNEDAVIIFVVEKGDSNRFDQKTLEYSFHDSITRLGIKKHVPVLFRCLEQIYENGKLNEDGSLIFEKKEVALCYFRAGYAPSHFQCEEAWKGRLMIERSTVPKCPNMAEQLVGTKKIQQVFAAPGMVERFIQDAEAVKRIRRTFAGLYTLDPGADGDAAAEMALNVPSRYVLKPQREGGGNNMYDNDMVTELKRITDPVERSQYILMERVQPPIVKNYIVHVDHDKPSLADTVTELGVFGVFISDGEKEIFNKASGHLLRTKDIEHKDGGVAAGRAVLDTPYLI